MPSVAIAERASNPLAASIQLQSSLVETPCHVLERRVAFLADYLEHQLLSLQLRERLQHGSEFELR